MGRAFSPWSRYCLQSWGVAPGWYESGFRPSENDPNRQFHVEEQRKAPMDPITSSTSR